MGTHHGSDVDYSAGAYAENVTGEEDGIQPVPVYLVEAAPTTPQPPATFSVVQHVVNPPAAAGGSTNLGNGVTAAQLIAGFLPQRTRLTIKNTGTNPVLLAPDQSLLGNSSGGYPLNPTDPPLVMTHAAEVWAYAPLGSTVSVISEFTRQ